MENNGKTHPEKARSWADMIERVAILEDSRRACEMIQNLVESGYVVQMHKGVLQGRISVQVIGTDYETFENQREKITSILRELGQIIGEKIIY